MIPGPVRRYGRFSFNTHFLDFFRHPIVKMRQHLAEFGEISGVVAPVPAHKADYIFAFGAENNRQIFSKPDLFHTSAMLSINHASVQRLSSGLAFHNEAIHKQQRRLVMPAFHRQTIPVYYQDMLALTQAMLSRWDCGEVVDISQEMHNLTAAIAIKTLFGLDAGKEGQVLSGLISQWMRLATSPWLRILPLDVPGFPHRRIKRVSDQLELHFRELLARKRADERPQWDALATLMHAVDEDGQYLSDDDLLGNINVLFLAGHETSANALTWTLFLLATHPDALDAVRQELAKVLQGKPPTLAQLQHLHVLEQTITESMRLLPPLVWITRTPKETTTLGAHTVAAGSTLVLSHFITHHMANLYPHPQRFAPQRWCNATPKPYEYMAFSTGPRRCVGAEFAMMEMKIVLATLLQRFSPQLLAEAEVNPQVTVTLSPKGGLPVRLCPAHHHPQPVTIRGTIHELVEFPTG